MPRYRTAIHWFRRDLRLSDNAALHRAATESECLAPVYVASDWEGSHAWTGPGRQAFLCGCLDSLAKHLERAGGRMLFRRGRATEELASLLDETGAEALYANRDPDPFGAETERAVGRICRERGVDFHLCKDAVLHEPGEVHTAAGTPYRVYTPYSRSWFERDKESPLPAVRTLRSPRGPRRGRPPRPEDWGLTFAGPLLREPGERAARERLGRAVSHVIGAYGEMRNDPHADATSHLGADLRWGTLSVREVWARSEEARREAPSAAERDSIHAFQRQLAWREFFMSVMGHHPEVLETEFNEDWRGLEWDDPEKGDKFERWQEGRTGFPIVDAGMRQLAATGYMHNRLRMICAMFLTKDLHLHWRLGESHFMQHLLDGEIASNNGGWQWSAGTGADAAPYFRIQNPWTQARRHDPEGRYVKRWIPELEGVEARRFFEPPASGEPLAPGYPEPIVDHAEERERTLRRFQQHRKSQG